MDTRQQQQDPAPGDDPLWLPLADAARALGKNERTIRTWLTLGRIRGRRVEQAGRLEWRVYVGEEDPPPDPLPAAVVQVAPADQPPDPAAVVTIAREQFQLLLAEHQRACARIGVLEEQLRDRIPAIEAGTRETRGEVAALAGQVLSLSRAGEGIAAAQGGIHRRIRVLTVALLVAVVGSLALTRRTPPPRSPDLSTPATAPGAAQFPPHRPPRAGSRGGA